MSAAPVIVAGGSLVGLSAALFLAWHKVPVIAIEKHPGSSLHPRAIGFTPRTLELFRAVGLGERIPQVRADFQPIRARVESLAGEWFERSTWTPAQANGTRPSYSPCSGAAIAQDRLEPILYDRAIELGADIRLETELVAFATDAEGITATLRPAAGPEYRVRGSYLVAADGAASTIRETLGIRRSGNGHLRTLRSVLFAAPLQEYLDRGVTQFEIDQPDFKAFLTTYGDGRWVLMFPDDAARDTQALRQAIGQAIGDAACPIELLATGRWELGAFIAERFVAGRVLIAGDAAHVLPPSRGGYGANTGIQDAHNLAWKLASVTRGTSTAALLDTYEAERQPIAWLRHQQIFARPDYKAQRRELAEEVAIINDDAMEFGELYRSSAVIGADADLAPALRPDEWAGQPGTRAPHLWVMRERERVSTLDLFRGEWVLLASDERWRSAAARAAARLGISLRYLGIGSDLEASDLQTLYAALGHDPRSASLIRPDGIIAWRVNDPETDPSQLLPDVLAQLLSAPGIHGVGLDE